MSGSRSRTTVAFWALVLVVAGVLGAAVLFTHVVGRTTVEPPRRPAG